MLKVAGLAIVHALHDSHYLKWDSYCFRGLVPPDCHFERSNHAFSGLSGYWDVGRPCVAVDRPVLYLDSTISTGTATLARLSMQG